MPSEARPEVKIISGGPHDFFFVVPISHEILGFSLILSLFLRDPFTNLLRLPWVPWYRSHPLGADSGLGRRLFLQRHRCRVGSMELEDQITKDPIPSNFAILLGGLEHFLFFHNILGMSSSHLTNSYFSEG